MTNFGSLLIVLLTIAIGALCFVVVWRAFVGLARAAISDVAKTAARAVEEDRERR